MNDKTRANTLLELYKQNNFGLVSLGVQKQYAENKKKEVEGKSTNNEAQNANLVRRISHEIDELNMNLEVIREHQLIVLDQIKELDADVFAEASLI